MKIPICISDRLDMARALATDIVDAVKDAYQGCDILLCGSSLDPENRSPNDMDLAVVSSTDQSHRMAVANLRIAFPDARIDVRKNYSKIKGVPCSPVHLWLLRKKDVSEDKRIQETLMSGRQYDKSSNNWIQPIS